MSETMLEPARSFEKFDHKLVLQELASDFALRPSVLGLVGKKRRPGKTTLLSNCAFGPCSAPQLGDAPHPGASPLGELSATGKERLGLTSRTQIQPLSLDEDPPNITAYTGAFYHQVEQGPCSNGLPARMGS